MALKGNLRDFNLTQLLNLINLAHKTGTLVVEGPGEVISVCFRDGTLAYAQDGNEKDNLIKILHHFNKLSTTQKHILNERLGHMSDKEVGLVLINANYIKQAEILSCLQAYFTEILQHVQTWIEGLFQFESNLMPPPDKITVRMNLDNVILDFARRQQLYDQLNDEIPDLEMELKVIERPGVKIRDLKLNTVEQRLLAGICPGNNMQKIASENQLDELSMRQVVYNLMQAGIIEIVRPEGMHLQFPILNRALKPVPTATPAGKSLINRLIDRIRAI